MFTVEKLENTNQKNDNKKSHLFLLSRDNHCYPVSFKHCHVSKYIFLQKTNHILSAHYNPYYLFFFYKFIYFIYLFLVVLGLRCCVRAFSSCSERGLLFIAVRRLLIAVASLVVEHRL